MPVKHTVGRSIMMSPVIIGEGEEGMDKDVEVEADIATE